MRKHLTPLAIILWALVATPLAYSLAPNFPRDLARVLVYEGGNDDDAFDPGGRTSRGITQREWNEYRKTHPGLPSDVWRAPQSAIEDIYRQSYWAVCRGDDLPGGLDLTIFDYCVNSGIGRGGKVLRRVLKLSDNDWRITPEVIAKAKEQRAAIVINAVNDERHAFVHSLSTCWRFCKGWDARIASVRANSLRDAGQQLGRIGLRYLPVRECRVDGVRCGKAIEEAPQGENP